MRESLSVMSEFLQPCGLSMEFSNKNTFPSPGDLPDSVVELGSPALQADSLQSESPGKSL